VTSVATTLDTIADPAGRFAILAMDQRGSLRKMLAKAGRPADSADLSAFKVDVVAALSPFASGVLTDADYGVGPVLAAGALHPGAGLLVASEDEQQPTWNGEPRTRYRPDERGPAFVAAAGGVALKFLVRWRPDRPAREGEPDLAAETVDAVRAVVADCRAYGLPSVVEPLVTGAPPDEHGRLVVRSAELLAELRPDLLKLEWPGDEAGCRALTTVCGPVPWTLLSAGVGYEEFVRRVLVAMDAGACGYIAGRAFWGEAAALGAADRREFLGGTGARRMADLNAATEGRGRSWRDVAC
jgi:tagatose 1,6-diphosphate aldolase/sulfofructosephosphate aldolase